MKEFKLIVAGGRDFDDYELFKSTLIRVVETELVGYEVSLVSGMARGADLMAHRYAQKHGILCYEFPADWGRYGKRAGFVRNQAMAHFADGLLAFWDGKSRGTKHMIATMTGLQKPTEIVGYTEYQPAGPDEGDAASIY